MDSVLNAVNKIRIEQRTAWITPEYLYWKNMKWAQFEIVFKSEIAFESEIVFGTKQWAILWFKVYDLK